VAGTTPQRHEAALTCIEHVFGYVGTVADVVPAFGLAVPAIAG
jgi:hypothetical protein